MRNKIIILILLCFLGVYGFSQAPAPSGFASPYSTGYYRIGWLQSDSGSIPAYRDTNWIPKFQFTEIVWLRPGIDSSKWIRVGNKWIKELKQGDITPAVWGSITGTLSSQTDLQNALNGKLSNITGYIQAGINVTLSGLGTQASPYVINSTASGTGTVTSFSFTNGNGLTGTVTNASTTPNLSLGTTLNGIINANGTGFGTVSIGSGLSYSGGVLSATGGTSLNGLVSANGSAFTTASIGAGLSFSANTLTNTINNTNQLTNGAGFITNITGLVTPGTNVTVTGSGTSGSPYVINSTASGTGTVTTFSSGNLSPLFTTTVTNPNTTPALQFNLSNAIANSVFGNNTGSSAAPIYYVPTSTILNGWFGGSGIQPQLSGTGYVKFASTTPSYLTPTQVTADLNIFTTSLQGLVPGSGGGTTNFLRADGNWAAPPPGTVTSVALSTPSFLTTAGSPITTSGTFTVTLATQTANTVFGNHTGGSAAPTFGKVVLADQATNTANYIQGWDGSGNPTALAPDTLFVLNRVSGTGVQVGNIYSDTLYLNNLVAGTNVSLTKNADSSITINSTGGGLATNNADSIRHLFVDTTGMYNGDLPYYNVLSNTYKFKQSNDKEGYLGILYQKATPVAADFAVFGTASLATVGGKLQISGGSGFGSGANLTAYGITRLARWKIQYRIINITPGNGNGAGINSTNAWASNAFSVLGRVDLRTAGGSQTILNGGNNPASLSLLTTGNSAANGAANDTTLITVERILDSVKVVAYNRTKNAYSSAVYGYNIYSGGINMANTGYFAIFSFGGTQQIDSLTISTTEIKNAQAAYIGDSKCIGYLDSVYSYAIGPKTDAYIPTTISWSEGSDRTTEVLTALHELWLLSPKQVFLEIGSNDPRSGLSNATYQANFTAIYDSCIVHGIRPIVLLPFFETAQDLSGQVTFLQSSFPASRVIDTWTPIKSNPTRFLTNGAADGIHPNYNGTDTLVQTIVKAYAYQGGTNSVNAYIKNNPSTQQLGANFNIQGSGTMFGGTVLGGTTFGTNRFLINGKTSTNNNFFLYENSSTGMEFGNYIDGGTAGAKSTWTGSAMLIGKRQGSATTEIARWDTSGAGHYFMGRTTDDGTGAPMQLYTSNFGVLSLSSSSASGAYISLSNTGTGVIGYFGTGSIATGANINDFSIRSQVTGKLWFAKNGGTAMGLLDNGNLNLGSSFTSNASALVNLTSTTQGFLFPRMTLAQFTAIGSKATSLHTVLTDSSGRLALYDGAKIVTYATTDLLTNIYNSDGTLTSNRTVANGGFNLTTSGSGIFSVNSPFALGSASASDANYTISDETTVKLPTITANRVLTFPNVATYAGRMLTVSNYNTASFTWTYSGAVNDPTGTGLGGAILVNGATYRFYSDGSSWIIANVQYPVTTAAIAGWQTITSGSSGTVNAFITNVLFNPASAIASYTLTLPANPPDGALVKVHFGGTIAGNATVVTSLTINANSGQTLMQKVAPTTALGGDCFIYQYNLALSTWYREQ